MSRVSGFDELGRFSSEFGGYIELHGNWVPDHSPDDAAQTLLDVAGYYGNLEVPLIEAQRIAEADTAKRFQTETDPDENAWKQLSARYHHKKVELEGFPDEILTREELLRDTAPTGWHIVGPSLAYDPAVLPRSKSGASYGAVMQEGSNRVPARPFIGLSETAIGEIATVFETWSETIPIEEMGMASNVLGEFPAVGGFYRVGGYQPMIRLPSGRVSFGRIVK